jgi:hypothetical protein
MLSFSVAFERLKPISRRNSKIGQFLRCMEHLKPGYRPALNISRQPLQSAAVFEEPTNLFVLIGSNHSPIVTGLVNNVNRYYFRAIGTSSMRDTKPVAGNTAVPGRRTELAACPASTPENERLQPTRNISITIRYDPLHGFAIR